MTPGILNHLENYQTTLQKISWRYNLATHAPRRLASLPNLSATDISTVAQMINIENRIPPVTNFKKLNISLKCGKIGGRGVSNADSLIRGFFKMMTRKTREKSQGHRAMRRCAPKEDNGAVNELMVILPPANNAAVEDVVEDAANKVEAMKSKVKDCLVPAEKVDHRSIDRRFQLSSLRLGYFPFLDSSNWLSTAINLSKLKSLTLRGCPQTHKLLDFWRNSKSTAITLKKLHLLLLPPESESNPDGTPVTPSQITTSVNQFIGAFSGLQDLYLLSKVHENYPFPEIAVHSATLERLVLDSKPASENGNPVRETFHNFGLLGRKLTTLQIRNVYEYEGLDYDLDDSENDSEGEVTIFNHVDSSENRYKDSRNIALRCFNQLKSSCRFQILSMAASRDIKFTYTKDFIPSSVHVPEGYIDERGILGANEFTRCVDTNHWEPLADVFYI
ncbi:hypothetical protein RUND412_010230, partial [Rhizina undulata]